jgi:hypothetical protein
MKKKTEDPSPLPVRICACGCGIEFQPTRSDQMHLNSKHYNYAYNHGARKEKYAEEIDVTKCIRKNDRILEKYFSILKASIGKLNLIIVKKEGFDIGRFTKIIAIQKLNTELKYFALYKYCYRIINERGIEFIEIKKL